MICLNMSSTLSVPLPFMILSMCGTVMGCMGLEGNRGESMVEVAKERGGLQS